MMDDFYVAILDRDADERTYHVAVLDDTDWQRISTATSFPGPTKLFSRDLYRRYFCKHTSLFDASDPAHPTYPARIYKLRRKSR